MWKQISATLAWLFGTSAAAGAAVWLTVHGKLDGYNDYSETKTVALEFLNAWAPYAVIPLAVATGLWITVYCLSENKSNDRDDEGSDSDQRDGVQVHESSLNLGGVA